MRRFITYLYEYNNGRKQKNVGFARVDQRNDRVNMELHIRYYHNSRNVAKAYALVWNKELLAVELGEVSLGNGQSDRRIEFASDNIMESGYHVDAMVGIAIVTEGQGYLASCWKDELAEEIAGGRYRIPEAGLQAAEEIVEPEVDAAPQVSAQHIPDVVARDVVEPCAEVGEMSSSENTEGREPQISELQISDIPKMLQIQENNTKVVYRKMELNEIRLLPRRNWRLCNNRFLIHGFFNYGYLVVKTEDAADGKNTYLGVPGIYEKPEMVVAAVFDFTNFQEIPEAVSKAEMAQEVVMEEATKNHNPKEGTFGLWLTPLYL